MDGVQVGWRENCYAASLLIWELFFKIVSWILSLDLPNKTKKNTAGQKLHRKKSHGQEDKKDVRRQPSLLIQPEASLDRWKHKQCSWMLAAQMGLGTLSIPIVLNKCPSLTFTIALGSLDNSNVQGEMHYALLY